MSRSIEEIKADLSVFFFRDKELCGELQRNMDRKYAAVQEYLTAVYGIRKGDMIVDLNRPGVKFLFEAWVDSYSTMNSLLGASQGDSIFIPTIIVRRIKKDGTPAESTNRLYYKWEKVTE